MPLRFKLLPIEVHEAAEAGDPWAALTTKVVSVEDAFEACLLSSFSSVTAWKSELWSALHASSLLLS